MLTSMRSEDELIALSARSLSRRVGYNYSQATEPYQHRAVILGTELRQRFAV